MKITALEIKQHEFEKSFRGYNIEEVDIFLNNIASEWERTSNEAKMLRMQLEIAEKEATKLREVEMSLIKTLQNAESTSNKITEHAQSKANAQLENARIESERIMNEAIAHSEKIKADAEQYAQELISKSKSSSEELLISTKESSEKLRLEAERFANELSEKAKKEADALVENTKIEVSQNQQKQLEKESTLKAEIAELEDYKAELIAQLKAFTSNTIERLQHIAPNAISSESSAVTAPKVEVAPVAEDTLIPAEEEITEEPVSTYDDSVYTEETEEEEEVVGFASSANNITLVEEVEQINEAVDDLTHIEGIGPKIAEILASNRVTTYRELAITPNYKIKEWLTQAGSNYAMHDPTSWPEQAMLASKGEWDELDALKDRLIAGKEPVAAPSQETKTAEAPTNEQNTEEMLDRVNKVKAALKKAMQDKENATVITTNTPVTASPVIDKQTNTNQSTAPKEGGSFFDSLN